MRPVRPRPPRALGSFAPFVSLGAAAALASGCASGSESTRLGYVVAPSVPADLATAPPPPRTGGDAGFSTYRALPPEPIALGCTREVLCQREEDEVPSVAFPPPFERCSERYAKGVVVAPFSAVETRRARTTEPATCCYVELRNCGGRPR